MKNVKWTLTGHILTIRVDLTPEVALPVPAKAPMIAHTEGNAPLGPERKKRIGLHVYRLRKGQTGHLIHVCGVQWHRG